MIILFKSYLKGRNEFNMYNEETQFIFQRNTLFGIMLMPAS